MPRWIWQQPGWTNFQFDTDSLRAKEDAFILHCGQAIALFQRASTEEQASTLLDLFEEEAAATSLIEDVILDRRSFRSSLRRALGYRDSGKSNPREAGVAALMNDLVTTYQDDLTSETLGKWHQLVMAGSGGIREIGHFRTLPDEMQVVDGPVGREKVWYVAPPSDALPDLMAAFLEWFNASRNTMPAVMRSGLAHFWFEMLHPFEDGNGRIGRAISQKALGQAIGSPPMAMLSEIVHQQKRAYYSALDKAQRGGALQDWLAWFSDTVVMAQQRTIQRIDFVVAKTHFLDRHSETMNSRQNKAIIRMFEEGPDGFDGGLSAKNYISITGATVPTTTRDLNDLVKRGLLIRTGSLKSTRYWLKI